MSRLRPTYVRRNAVVWITWDRGCSWFPGRVLEGRDAPRGRVLVQVFNNPFGPYLFPLSSLANYLEEHTHLRQHPKPEMRLAVEAANQFIRTEGIAEQKAQLKEPNSQAPLLPTVSAPTKQESIPLRLRIRQPRLLERFAARSTTEPKRPTNVPATIRVDADTSKAQKKYTTTSIAQNIARSDSRANDPASSTSRIVSQKVIGATLYTPQPNIVIPVLTDKAVPSARPSASVLVKSESKPSTIPTVTKLIQPGATTSHALEHPASHVVSISMTGKPAPPIPSIGSPLTPNDARDNTTSDKNLSKRMPWHTSTAAALRAAPEQGVPPAKRARLSANGTAVQTVTDSQCTVTERTVSSATATSLPSPNPATASSPASSIVLQRTVTSSNVQKQQPSVAKVPPMKATSSKRATAASKKQSKPGTKTLHASTKRATAAPKKPPAKVSSGKRANIAPVKQQQPVVVKAPRRSLPFVYSTVPPAPPATPVSVAPAVPRVPMPSVSLQLAAVLPTPPPATPLKSIVKVPPPLNPPNANGTIGCKRPREEVAKSAFMGGLEEILRSVLPSLERILLVPCEKERLLRELELVTAERDQTANEYEQLRKRCSEFIDRRNTKESRKQQIKKRKEQLKSEVARRKKVVEKQERQIAANKAKMTELARKLCF